MANPSSVVLAPEAFCTISLHALRHKNSTVHGALIGSHNKDKKILRIEQALPICHGAPTLPLVEAALGLLPENQTIVGWYTAPLLLKDTAPSPVALKMVESVESDQSESPVLLVVQNETLGLLIQQTGQPNEVLKAYGKDNSRQWIRPLTMTLEDSSKSSKAILEALQQKYELNDFVDHLAGPATSSFFPDKSLAKIVGKTKI
jgi:hypothetical protein